MPRKAEPSVYVAKESFSCEIDGERFFVTKGEKVRRGHALLRSQADSFEPSDQTVHYDVEQATAAPGESRA